MWRVAEEGGYVTTQWSVLSKYPSILFHCMYVLYYVQRTPRVQRDVLLDKRRRVLCSPSSELMRVSTSTRLTGAK